MTALELFNNENAIKQLNYSKLLSAKTFHSDAQAIAFLDDLSSREVEKKSAALRHLMDAICLPNDYLHGKAMTSENGVWGKVAKMISAKSLTGLTHTATAPQIVAEFESSGNELLRDMEWMAAFSMFNITGAQVAEIVDIISLVEWAEYEFNKEINTSAYKQDSATYLTAQRFGGGLAFNRLDFERHPMVSLNRAIEALRIKAVDLKIINAYTTIQAGITAANGAGWTTTYNANGVAATINEARNTLIERNANLGYQMSFNQPVELYTNPANYDYIQSVFAAWFPTQANDGTGGTTPANNIRIVPNTIRTHYTYNLAADFGLGTAAFALILPGQKNIWCDFDPLRFGQNQNIKIDGLEIIGQEYYASQIATDQIQIGNLV